jgi:hypothetical protein
MTNKQANELFASLQSELEKDRDPFMFVHFSRVEGGTIIGKDGAYLNKGDVLFIIKHLVDKFKINRVDIASLTDKKLISN